MTRRRRFPTRLEMAPHLWQMLTTRFLYGMWSEIPRGCWVQYELDGERFFFQLISSHLDVSLGQISGDFYERDVPFVAPDGKRIAGAYFIGAVFHQDAVLENLRRRKICHVDLAGRVFIRRERLLIDRTLSPLARTWPIKKPKKALTEKTRAALDESVGRILYILLQNPACKWNTSRMQQASGLSTGCVYKALKELRAFGWINSYGHGDWRVLNTDEIARVLRVEKSKVVPIGSAAQLSRVFKDTVLPDFPGKLMPGAAEGFLRFQFDGVEFNLRLRPVLDIRKSDISARLRKYLLVTTRLSLDVIKHCAHLKICCADLTGRVLLRADKLLVDVEGRPELRNLQFRTPWKDPVYFNGKASRIPTLMLSNPDQPWNIHHLKNESGLSVRTIFWCLSYMKEQGWVKCSQRGFWQVTRPGDLASAMKAAGQKTRPRRGDFLRRRIRYRKASTVEVPPGKSGAGEGSSPQAGHGSPVGVAGLAL